MRLCKFRPSSETRLELSTTSMIDVVFLLLIFFLVTTTFLTPERQLKSNIRYQDQTASQTSDDIEPAFVDVIRENGVAVFRIGTVVSSQIDEIERVLRQYPEKSKGAIVRYSDEAPFGMAAQAINACKKSGFVIVSFTPLR